LIREETSGAGKNWGRGYKRGNSVSAAGTRGGDRGRLILGKERGREEKGTWGTQWGRMD